MRTHKLIWFFRLVTIVQSVFDLLQGILLLISHPPRGLTMSDLFNVLSMGGLPLEPLAWHNNTPHTNLQNSQGQRKYLISYV